MKQMTELQKKNVLRQSNKESNALTRECIESALVLLMKEQSFSEITITDIIRKAGVSRASYYRNYSSKEDILEKFLQKITIEYSNALTKYDPSTESFESWLELLSRTRKLAPQFKLLLQAGFGEKILDRFIAQCNKSNNESNPDLFITNCYTAGGIYSVLSQWVLSDMEIADNTIATICSDLMMQGLKNPVKCALVEDND